MAQTLNYTRIPAPRVPLVDPQSGVVSNEWFRFFTNIYSITYSGTTVTTAGTYGSATSVARVSINEFGVITGLSNIPIAINANQIVSGSLTTTYGGTGITSYAVGDISYYASGAALSKLPIGAGANILTSSGTAPQWSDPATVTVGNATNIAGGLANQVPYQTAPDTTAFNANLTFDGTNLNVTGNIFATAGTTTMADGFNYIPAASGVPTGVPTAKAGYVPMYYNTATNRFYVYNGAWRSVLLA
jgi:hypothetical protein